MTAPTKSYFRPTLESLETRDMLDAGFVNAVTSNLPQAVYRDVVQTSNQLLLVINYQTASTSAAALAGMELAAWANTVQNATKVDGHVSANSMNPAAVSAVAIQANESLLGLYAARWAILDAEAREAFFA